MQRYDPGDAASLRREVTDPDGVPTDATVTFSYLVPGQTVWSSASTTHNGTGIYDVSISELIKGLYRYKWNVSGPITDVTTGRFYVADEDAEVPPLAAFELLARKLGGEVADFDDTEFDRGCYLLDEASELIRDVAGKTWIDDDTGALLEVPRRIARICVAAAARAFNNPEGLSQRTMGDSSKSYDRTNREGGEVVYLTDAEKADVIKAAGRSGFTSVTLTSPYSADYGTDLDTWAMVTAE